ncbi:hypothetical protein KQX54_016749 [Cotesia glomerata]|uniref:Uncharacterized protein n=1 Tax=Cotesia glomerata TaxID=32391 RepID=A0AAV7ICF6_COTGL|nr:hypothetical protein KQX54_016749 [Cotesia glomerata]
MLDFSCCPTTTTTTGDCLEWRSTECPLPSYSKRSLRALGDWRAEWGFSSPTKGTGPLLISRLNVTQYVSLYSAFSRWSFLILTVRLAHTPSSTQLPPIKLNDRLKWGIGLRRCQDALTGSNFNVSDL